MNDDKDFIRAILADPADDTLRLVYADWLEERGDPRAEFLRLELALVDVPDLEFYRHHLEERRVAIRSGVDPLDYVSWLEQEGGSRAECVSIEDELHNVEAEERNWFALGVRFEELRRTLDPNWLALLDRTPVENCQVRFRFKCPKKWQSLKLTDDSGVRFCDACQENVFYCGSVGDARHHAMQGHCVALNSHLQREPGDLDETALVLTTGALDIGTFDDSERFEIGEIVLEDEEQQAGRPPRYVMPDEDVEEFMLGVMDLDDDQEADVPKERKAWWKFW